MPGMQKLLAAGLKNRAMDRMAKKTVVAIQGHTLRRGDSESCLSRKKSASEERSDVDSFLASMFVVIW